MMRRTLIGAAVMFTLLLIASSRPVQAQGLASLAAAASGSSMAVEKTPTCWGCGYYGGPGFPTGLCQAGGSGSNSGLKCESTMAGPCRFSGGACGSSALVPVDPDGTSQYVSRGSRLGLLVVMKDGDPDVRRNCQGVVIARAQTASDIDHVRSSTGTLTL